ncbi:MAG: TonB-dependent receptor plug domain-containing protein, partial [Alistipes sp.]|nr:TonB-dependent receptor plug domain-containing protein [Alistipes sp.]
MNHRKNNMAAWIVCACLTLSAAAGYGQEPAETSAAAPDEEQTVDLGYYSLPARAVTGAVSSVSGKELRRTPDASLPRTFAGRFSGLTTLESNTELSRGAFDTESIGMSWWIRGLSTVNGSTPMIIIDGVLCPNASYAYLSPDEVESVTVLKDASVLARYGIQGANGAISIRTRRGHVGKTHVTVTIDQSLQQMTRRPPFVNSGDYVDMRNQAGYNDGLGRYSQFSQSDAERFRAGGDELYPSNDWFGMFVRPLTYMTRAGVTVYGGSQKVQYFSNVNYMHQQSPFRTVEEAGSKYDPQPANNWINFRSNVDVKFNSYLSGFLRLAGNVKNERTTGYSNAAIYDHLFTLPPTMYGPLTPSGDGYENGGQVVTHDDESLPVYGMLNRSGYINNLYVNITAQAGLNLDLGFLTEGLSLGGTMAYQTNSLNQTRTTQNFERYIRTKDLSGLYFTQKGSDLNTPLSYGKSTTMDYNLNLYAHADYNRRFGDHSINALGYIFYQRQELQKSNLPYKRESMGATVTYGFRNRYFIKGDIGYSGSDQF